MFTEHPSVLLEGLGPRLETSFYKPFKYCNWNVSSRMYMLKLDGQYKSIWKWSWYEVILNHESRGLLPLDTFKSLFRNPCLIDNGDKGSKFLREYSKELTKRKHWKRWFSFVIWRHNNILYPHCLLSFMPWKDLKTILIYKGRPKLDAKLRLLSLQNWSDTVCKQCIASGTL